MGWEELERTAYEKWKKEHPDVMHGEPKNIGGLIEMGTPHQWWVRNYVDTRLYPLIHSLLAEAEEKAVKRTIDQCNKGVPTIEKMAREEGAAEEREKNRYAIHALALMWNQYCGKEGHLYMTAGEAALEVLQREGLLSDNHEEIDYGKIDHIITPNNL